MFLRSQHSSGQYHDGDAHTLRRHRVYLKRRTAPSRDEGLCSLKPRASCDRPWIRENDFKYISSRGLSRTPYGRQTSTYVFSPSFTSLQRNAIYHYRHVIFAPLQEPPLFAQEYMRQTPHFCTIPTTRARLPCAC